MIFTPLASSSRGNCYLVREEGLRPLLLEAGISIKQIREHLYKHTLSLTDLAGCLVSHEHQDHAKAVKDLLKAGITCYMGKGTAEALDVIDHHNTIFLTSGYQISTPQGWDIWPIGLQHDAAEPLGFVIYDTPFDSLLFIPDTAHVRNRFKGITQIAVECNHIGDILADNIQSGAVAGIVGRRVRRNHMSLETLIAMLKANDLSQCRKIWLLHLSDANSDEARMVREVQEATGIATEAA